MERFLALFEGTKAASPAAAMAGWKRAAPDPKILSRRGEVVLAFLNPAMVPELRTLDGAAVDVGFDPGGKARWSATVPADDGTFAALATAMALTDGGPDAPIGEARVDRLGRPGSPLLGQRGATVIAAGTRNDLQAALDRLPLRPPTIPSGLHARLDVLALGPAGPPARRRLAGTLRALNCREIEGRVVLEGETLNLVATGRFSGRRRPSRSLDPAWLDWLPADRTLAAVAMAIDPSPEAWDAAFAAADRVEKADPARADLAPVRSRVNLLALAVGVRPEADLWPHLLGLSAFATASPDGGIDGALIAFHLDAESAAIRVADRVLPRLAGSFRLDDPAAPPDPEDGIRRLGRLAGRPFLAARRGPTVLLAWGERALTDAIDSREHLERSAGPPIRAAWTDRAPQRAGAFWPGRLPGLAVDSPVAASLRGAPPAIWCGERRESTTRDEVRWTGLRGVVRRYLDRLPMDPPPDRSTVGGPPGPDR